MAGDEPVTSPDQHKPMVSRRLAWIGAVLGALSMLAMIKGNHQGQVENLFLIGFAVLLLLIPTVDFILRRSGLKSD